MNLRAEAKSETSIGLSWSAPRQESVIKYELLFREGDRGREVPGLAGRETTAGLGEPRWPPIPLVSAGSSLVADLCLSLPLCPCVPHPLPPICSQVGRTFDPTTAFVVEDLKPNTEYAFRLAARSPQGLGAFTSVVRQRTLQASTCLLAPCPWGGGSAVATDLA